MEFQLGNSSVGQMKREFFITLGIFAGLILGCAAKPIIEAQIDGSNFQTADKSKKSLVSNTHIPASSLKTISIKKSDVEKTVEVAKTANVSVNQLRAEQIQKEISVKITSLRAASILETASNKELAKIGGLDTTVQKSPTHVDVLESKAKDLFYSKEASRAMLGRDKVGDSNADTIKKTEINKKDQLVAPATFNLLKEKQYQNESNRIYFFVIGILLGIVILTFGLLTLFGIKIASVAEHRGVSSLKGKSIGA
jgi:hypothetical protein